MGACRAKELMGATVKDAITGFEGIVVTYAHHITGCDSVGLSGGLDKEGKRRDREWFDVTRVTVTEAASSVIRDIMYDNETVSLPSDDGPGGPQENPPERCAASAPPRGQNPTR
jgi:hypothetical protein